MRDEARTVLQQQSELAWKSWVSGQEVDLASTYRGHDELFSSDSIAVVEHARTDASGDDARALQSLEFYLAGEVLARETADTTDEIQSIESGDQVSVGGVRFAYRDLDRVLTTEPSAPKRAKLYEGSFAILARLKPLLERRNTRIAAVLKRLELGTYAQFGARLRDADLGDLTKLAERVLNDTDALNAEAMQRLAMDELAIPLSKLRRSDIPRLFEDRPDGSAFPATGLVPAARKLFAGMGIDLTHQPGLTLDSATTVHKNPETVCLPVVVPTDVRVSVIPGPGAGAYRALFYELGQAEHYLNTTVSQWEFRELGDDTVGEAFAFLMEGVVNNPLWLQTTTPLRGVSLNRFVRRAATRQLFELRRDAAEALFQVQWRSGLLQQSPAEAYRQIMSRAYGFPLTAQDGNLYLADDDQFFYAADYLRAWCLAAQIDHYLQAYEGSTWWEVPASGNFLRSLWADGSRLGPDDVAERVEANAVEPDAIEETLTRRLRP